LRDAALSLRRRRGIVAALVIAVTAACAALALGLQPSAGIDTLVSPSSADYQATQAQAREFGAAPVVVLVRLPISRLTQPDELERVSRLEACLAGQQLRVAGGGVVQVPVPARSAVPYGGWRSPCGALMRNRPAKVVYGPGTFLNRAVAAVDGGLRVVVRTTAARVRRAEALARSIARARGLSPAAQQAAAQAAGELAAGRQLATLERAAGAAGLTSTPAINNPAFIHQIVFSHGGTGGSPNPRFSYLFPSAQAAVIQVRLRARLSDAQQSQAIGWIRQAVAMPRFRLAGGSYLVSGEPVVLRDLAGELSGQVALLLGGAVGVMALVLLTVFRRRLRLLPLAIALAACAITFGLLSLTGAGLTVAGVAVLPIVIGLAVDYAVQVQSGTSVRSIVVAALATAGGFLVLLLSPVPMVQGFAVLLIVGVCVAVALTLLVVPVTARVEFHNQWLWNSTRTGKPGTTRVGTIVDAVARHPAPVLIAGLALAAAGWALAARTPVDSDITKLVPQNMPALRDLNTLERVTGVSGEIDVLVHGANVATPRTVAWMARYERRITAHFGAGGGQDCRTATVCPAVSLPSLLLATTTGSATPSQQAINSLLRAVPGYFTRVVLSADRRYASLAFGIRLMPLGRQQRVVSYMRAQLHPPPRVTATVTGLPVLAADANSSLASGSKRLLMLIAGLAAVALILLAALRSPRRALAPLVPIGLATGWSALVVFALRIPLNPMSATLGALVIAISTEFSVLLSERAEQERRRGLAPGAAMAAAYRSTGAAVIVSGVTAIAGFGVLALSDIAMLRNFGVVTVVDLSCSLLGVLLVLPAALSLSFAGVRRRQRAAVLAPP